MLLYYYTYYLPLFAAFFLDKNNVKQKPSNERLNQL